MWAGQVGRRALEARSLAAVKTAIILVLIEGASDIWCCGGLGPTDASVLQNLGPERFVSSFTL